MPSFWLDRHFDTCLVFNPQGIDRPIFALCKLLLQSAY
jgi:hypothetical protein